MKKNANNLPLTFDRSGSNSEIKKLVSYLRLWGENNYFFDTNHDLLTSAMTEFIAGKSFSELPEERRKELFDQYTILRSVLDLIENFVNDFQNVDSHLETSEEVEHLLDSLRSYSELHSFFDMNYDLLAFAIPGFFASNTFLEYEYERKKDLFQHFSTLRNLLNYLSESDFISDYTASKKKANLVISR